MYTGVTFADLQADGTAPVLRDLVNMVVRIGEISLGRALRTLGGIPSGPGALEGSRLRRSFSIPSLFTLMSSMGGALRSGSLHLCLISSVQYCFPSLKAELNCLFRISALSLALVKSWPSSLRGGTPTFEDRSE